MADRLILDTSLLIDFERGHAPALAYVQALLDHDAAAIHPVSVVELLDGARSKNAEQQAVKLINNFPRLAVKPRDFDACIELMLQVRLAHGVGWADCLIAATCLRVGLPLVTLNDKHFRAVRRLRVVRPY